MAPPRRTTKRTKVEKNAKENISAWILSPAKKKREIAQISEKENGNRRVLSPVNKKTTEICNQKTLNDFYATQKFSDDDCMTVDENFAKEMGDLLKNFCHDYNQLLTERRGETDENDGNLKNVAKNQRIEWMKLISQMQNSVGRHLEECRNHMENGELNEKALLETITKEREAMKTSRRTIVNQIEQIENACNDYIKKTDNLEEKHRTEIAELCKTMRVELGERKKQVLGEIQKKDLKTMRRLFDDDYSEYSLFRID